MTRTQDKSSKNQADVALQNQYETDSAQAERKKDDPYGNAEPADNLRHDAHGNWKDIRPAKGSHYAPIGSLEFFGIFLLLLIPVVNIILLLVWAFGGCKKINKRNFARAYLVMLALFVGLGFWAFSAAKSFYHDAFVAENLTPGSPRANAAQFFRQKAADFLVAQTAKQLTDSASSPADAPSAQVSDLTVIASLAIAQDREGLRELGFSDAVIDGLLAAAKDPALLSRYLSQASNP
jgi:NADH:ubiquinone oxidoreductase subunit 3 (subunit A)